MNSFNKKLKINDIRTYLQEPKNRRSIILSRRSCSQHFSRNSADQERFSNMYVWSKRLNSEQTLVHPNLSRFESNIEYQLFQKEDSLYPKGLDRQRRRYHTYQNVVDENESPQYAWSHHIFWKFERRYTQPKVIKNYLSIQKVFYLATFLCPFQ